MIHLILAVIVRKEFTAMNCMVELIVIVYKKQAKCTKKDKNSMIICANSTEKD